MGDDETLLSVVKELRNWVRVASYGAVKTLLETALSDSKSRAAYQMLDGTASMDQVRITCKMSPNALVAARSAVHCHGINGDK